METGTVTNWNDKKGFGFIKTKSRGKDLFFHIKDYSNKHKKPKNNLEVFYFQSRDSQGRFCAIDVIPIKGHKNNGYEIRQQLFSIIVFGLFTTLLYKLLQLGKINIVVVFVYIFMSLLSFIMYAKDKRSAQLNRWRTSEGSLHLISLLGGWPGAKIAQSFLRHKSKKVEFRVVYWITVFINCSLLYWLSTPSGNLVLNDLLKNIN